MFAAEWSLLMLDVIGAGALGARLIIPPFSIPALTRTSKPVCGVIVVTKGLGGD
jgi:hypothetical protein